MQVALVGPVAQGVADDFAVGGVFSCLDGAADDGGHFGGERDAEFFNGRHKGDFSSKNCYDIPLCFHSEERNFRPAETSISALPWGEHEDSPG